MTTALIDGDIVCYRCAASCEKESKDEALRRANDLLTRILHEVKAEQYRLFLSGGDNYRYDYNPEYKANRRDVAKPQYLQDVREHLVVHWNASVEDGQEADDAMGITQMATHNTVICSIDKDLLMIPGDHYDFVKGIYREQSSVDAIRHFYWQLIMGDRTDNIFGFDGIARQSVPQKLVPVIDELNSYSDELDMFEFVRSLYDNDERLLMNGICLWIRRNPDEIWKFPT